MAKVLNFAEGKVNLHYQERVRNLRGRSYGSPGGPYRWCYAFEDVLVECLKYFDKHYAPKRYQFIESFIDNAHDTMKLIEDRESGRDFTKLKKNLCKIFIEVVCIKSIENRFQKSPDLRFIYIDLFRRFADFEVPSSKFSECEQDIVRVLGLPPFGERWSGYSRRYQKLISQKQESNK